MASFKDATGRVWPIRLNTKLARLVVAEHGIDLLILDNKEAGVFNRLTSSPHQITDVVWTLVRAHAKEVNVTDDQFLEAVEGPTIAAMTDALVEAVIDFFQHSPEKVRVLKAAFQKQQEMEKELASLAVAKIESLTLPPGILEETTGRTSID